MKNFKLTEVLSALFQKLSPDKIGKITVQEVPNGSEGADSYPVKEGCIRGVLTPLHEKQAYFSPYGQEGLYYTHRAYAEWPGAVVEAECEPDPSLEDPVKGWAYRVYIRNTSSGILFELPEPEQIPQGEPGDCRCPFCIIDLVRNN